MTAHIQSEALHPAVLDYNHVLNHAGGDPELLIQLCRLFLGDLPLREDQLQSAIAGRDYPRAGRALLQLQSCILVFGAGHASLTAEKLELAVRNRRDRRMKGEWMQLQNQLHALVPQVQRLLLEFANPGTSIH